jgi:hypothetical protein
MAAAAGHAPKPLLWWSGWSHILIQILNAQVRSCQDRLAAREREEEAFKEQYETYEWLIHKLQLFTPNVFKPLCLLINYYTLQQSAFS